MASSLSLKAGVAMQNATQALLRADLALAEQVIADYGQLAQMSGAAEDAAFVLLALQAPVASELRAVVAAIRVSADAERMGGLAVHVAKIVRRRHPEHVLPDQVNGYFAEMGRVAVDTLIPCPGVSSSDGFEAIGICDL